MDPQRSIPIGKLARITRLARLGARLGLEVTGAAATGMALPAIAERFHRDAAQAMRQALGELKGLPMKLGQMLSYVDDMIPPEARAIYRETLSELQRSARPVDTAVLVKVVEEELGAPLDALFAEFDRTPLASASIGQVYRARLHDGRAVAVKVQYPGIADAVASDLQTLELARKMASLALLGRLDVEQSLRDIRERILEECDYEQERRNVEAFAEAWRGDPDVWIPDVVPERCARRVLTTELVEGARTFQQITDGATQEERDRWARTLFRFVFRNFYVFGMFNTDPHPGNYLFLEGGRVACIDFGGVQRFERAAVDAIARTRHLVGEGVRGPVLRAAAVPAYGLDPGYVDDALWAFMEDYLHVAFAPVTSERFRFDRAFTQRLAKLTLSGKLVGAKKVLFSGVRESKLPGLTWLGRIQVGFVSILALLNAEGPWRAFMAEIDAERTASLLAR